MAGRDDQRQAAGFAAQQPADLLAAVAQWGERAAHVVQGHARCADEDFLRHADAGQAGGDAEMRGDAEPARMGDAVAVDECEVRRSLEHRQCLEQRGEFAEAEEAGDVRHARGQARNLLVNDLERVRIEQDGSRPRGGTSVLEADVEAGDGAQRPGEIVAEDDALREIALHDAQGGDIAGPVGHGVDHGAGDAAP